MQIATDEIENYVERSALGESSRFFFEAMHLPELEQTKQHCEKLGAVILLEKPWQSERGYVSSWALTFSYRGHTFLIDTNYHSANSLFFVGDPACSNEILLEVLQHFHNLSRLRYTQDELAAIQAPPRYTLGLVLFAVALVLGLCAALFAIRY